MTAKVCICCGKDIAGRPVALRPPDPKYALCRTCNDEGYQVNGRVVREMRDATDG